MVKTIQFKWKAFNINLVAIEVWARANISSYQGCSADKNFRVHFEDPSDEDLAEMIAKWEEIEEDHEWATSYMSLGDLAELADNRASAIRSKKLGMIAKEWAQMDTVEKKIFLGLESDLTPEELDLE